VSPSTLLNCAVLPQPLPAYDEVPTIASPAETAVTPVPAPRKKQSMRQRPRTPTAHRTQPLVFQELRMHTPHAPWPVAGTDCVFEAAIGKSTTDTAMSLF
jgi:hypothetical protein